MNSYDMTQTTILSEGKELKLIALLAYEFGLYVERRADRVYIIGSKQMVDHLFNALHLIGVVTIGLIYPLWRNK